MPTIDELALAIARMEGYGASPTNRPTRNHNPGNLRASSLATGKDADGYAIFPNAATGWDALRRQIRLDTDRGLNLSQFINKYAPPVENNTSSYLRNVMNWLGVGADTPLRAFADPSDPLPDWPTSGGLMAKLENLENLNLPEWSPYAAAAIAAVSVVALVFD